MATMVKHLRISGRVQGIGYRHFMVHTAHELSVTGWVRNRHDGSVEAVISGTPDAVHMMIERARRGPLHAMISDVKVSEAHGDFTRFDMLPTE